MLAIVGRNGAGKTSLLEAVHFAALGWSPRTSDDARVVRIGAAVTRVELRGTLRGAATSWAVGYQPGAPKRATVDGAAYTTARRARRARRDPRLHAGAPGRHEGRTGAAPALPRPRGRPLLAALRERRWRPTPVRCSSATSSCAGCARALGARRAARPGRRSSRSSAREIRRARGRLVAALRAPFAEHLAAIGGLEEPVELRYEARGPDDEAGQLAELAARRAADIERGTHLGRAPPRRARVRPGRARPAQLRLAGRAALRRARAPDRRGRPRARGARRAAACCCSTTSRASSTGRAPQSLLELLPRTRPGARDGDGHPPARRRLRPRRSASTPAARIRDDAGVSGLEDIGAILGRALGGSAPDARLQRSAAPGARPPDRSPTTPGRRASRATGR